MNSLLDLFVDGLIYISDLITANMVLWIICAQIAMLYFIMSQ